MVIHLLVHTNTIYTNGACVLLALRLTLDCPQKAQPLGIGPEGHSTLSHKTEYMNLTNCVSYHIIKHIHTNEVITLVITFNTCNKHTNVVLAFMPT